jgi:membrane fusion protein (multidrug efflux system)
MRLLHHQTRRAAHLTLVLPTILLGGLAGCDRASSDDSAQRQTGNVPVSVAEVRLETLRETVRGIGTLRAAETVEIKPEMDGIIREICFEEGQEVQRDQLLFALDDEKLDRQLAAGKAALRAARIRQDDALRLFRRMQELVERAVANQDELDDTETAYLAAEAEAARMEAEVQLLQAQLDDTRLVAPLTGVISERTVDVGDYVTAGDHLATLYRVSRMEIGFALPERYMGRIRQGQAVAVTVSAYPDREFDGRVYFVSPQVDETTRELLVKAVVENPEGLLKPGAFGTAVVTLDVREQCPVVPENALVATRTGYIVFVVNGEVARRREVSIGLRAAGTVEIRAGLTPGETVVFEGQMNLSDGTAVQIVRAAGLPDEPEKQPDQTEVDERP